MLFAGPVSIDIFDLIVAWWPFWVLLLGLPAALVAVIYLFGMRKARRALKKR